MLAPTRKCLVNYNAGIFRIYSKSKLMLFVAIISMSYLVMYTWTSSTCICASCIKTNIPRYKLHDKTSTTITTLSINNSSPKLSEKVHKELSKFLVKYPSNRQIFNYNLRNQGPATSSEEIDFLLNMRKLILFAVHEINKPLRNTGCVQFWANPLDLSTYEEISKSETHINHKIKFLIQPGNFIYLKVEIRQKLPPVNLNDTVLEIVSPFEFFDAPPFMGPCKNENLNEITRNTCICSTIKEVEKLQSSTAVAIQNWHYVDPELPTWKPKHSYMVGDYINFTDYEEFITSPGKTKNDIRDFKYSSEYCGPAVKMLVMIKSAPDHFHNRRAIRETYGSEIGLKGTGAKVVFLVGLTTDTKMNTRLLRESERYEDIIHLNYQESYHNLTLGHLAMYKWIQLTCGNGKSKGITLPKYILKADDDYLLNVRLALIIAEANPETECIGFLWCGTNAVRAFGQNSYVSKYYIPRYMYISGSYMGYLLGIAFILRSDVIPRLLHVSLTTPMIHMDDVYVTGMLLRQLNIYPRHSNLITAARVTPDACISKTPVSSRVENPQDMFVQWMKLIEPKPSNCVLDHLPIQVKHLDEAMKRKCFYE